jgi:hypothetical protein
VSAEGDSASWWRPGQSVSLRDMIKCSLGDYVNVVLCIKNEIKKVSGVAGGNAHAPISDDLQAQLRTTAEFIASVFNRVPMQSGDARLARLIEAIKIKQTHSEILYCLRALWEAMDDDSKCLNFYHYPRHKGLLLMRYPAEWAPTLTSFISAKDDIRDGVDCYACGHNTASVFHMMRVAEHGLRALLNERDESIRRRGKDIPIEWAQWGELMDALDRSINAIIGWSVGPSKDAASAFYTAARAHMASFKSEYRDRVSHTRESYDEMAALAAITRVRDFMKGLSTKLDERGVRIVW